VAAERAARRELDSECSLVRKTSAAKVI
jgi:hypothetical protein